jgi:hypothetical protein
MRNGHAIAAEVIRLHLVDVAVDRVIEAGFAETGGRPTATALRIAL